MQEIIYSQNIREEISRLLHDEHYDRTFILTEKTVEACCLPLVLTPEQRTAAAASGRGIVITIEPTDAHKNLESLRQVWEALQQQGASRHSLLINLGGGMLTDLGGFAAATFKRGMDFVNVPTTLLSMVDAAVGGKTGINFNGLKNEIGVFREAQKVVIDTQFLRTLNREDLRSGFAEMLKHALLSDERMWAEHLQFDLENPDWDALQLMVGTNIEVKRRIVSEDPTEKGIRKALNLGHTVGHALETLALLREQPLLHGYFVAWGLIAELYLSATLSHFPTTRMRQTVNFIRENYGDFSFTCKDYEQIYELMRHDKKNTGGCISTTLLGDIGDIQIDQHPSKEDFFEALDFLREG